MAACDPALECGHDTLNHRPPAVLPVWRRLRLDQQVFALALGAGIPGAFTALWVLWTEPYTPKVQWTLSVIILSTLFGLAASVRTRIVVPPGLTNVRDRPFAAGP